MGTEIEVKLAASKKTLERIERAENFPEWNVEKKGKIHLVSHYFDTYNFQLLYNNLAYRVREEGGNKVATLKSNGKTRNGIYVREEANKLLLDGEDVTSRAFLMQNFPKILEIINNEPLKEMLTVDNERHIIYFKKGNTLVEGSLDFLYFLKGKRKLPYNELELELKEGKEEDLKKLSDFLKKSFHLSLSGASKYEMGLRSFNMIPLF
jgi:inorganic triphosphatase YgiF